MDGTYATTWLGRPAQALENDQLRVVTVPGMGAKIVSIYNKTHRYEWLLGPGDRPFEPVHYGASFIEQDMSGWDEMFPTIVACLYPGDGPYAGAELPDHGEVWALPWKIGQTGTDQITLQVRGRALPYQLIRTMSLSGPQTLRMDYTATNTGDAPMACLWAAHPQFAVTPMTEVQLPDDIASVLAVMPVADWNATGLQIDWPVSTKPDGQPFALNRVTSAVAKQCWKVYVAAEQPVAWAKLVETGPVRHSLRLDWDAAQVPYLGIWADEGVYNPGITLALEPSNGFYDDLTLAWKNKRVPVIEPGGSLVWSLSVTLGND